MNIKPQQMEMFIASQMSESLGGNDRLLEMILDRRNMRNNPISVLPCR